MLNKNDGVLIKLLNSAITYLGDFQDTFQNKEIRRKYLSVLNEIFDLFKNKNGDDFDEQIHKSLYEIYCHIMENVNMTEEWKIKNLREEFSMFFLKQIPKYKNELYEENIWGAISEYMVVDTMEEYSRKISLYYKNILLEERWEIFEKMIEFIRGELVRYHLNIVYCKKIVSFMKGFNEKGVFPSDLQFLNRYLDTAVSEMILVQTKLFSNANTNKQDNFGFDYLKAFISNYSKDRKEVSKLLGGETRKKIKEAKDNCKKLENIRNGMLAHYDVRTIQEGITDIVSIDELEILYDISVDLLEIMSLHYFERKDSAFLRMIEIHGFRKAVLENPIMDMNRTPDLDEYLNILRGRFIDKMTLK